MTHLRLLSVGVSGQPSLVTVSARGLKSWKAVQKRLVDNDVAHSLVLVLARGFARDILTV